MTNSDIRAKLAEFGYSPAPTTEEEDWRMMINWSNACLSTAAMKDGTLAATASITDPSGLVLDLRVAGLTSSQLFIAYGSIEEFLLSLAAVSRLT